MKNTVAYFIWAFVCLLSLHSCIAEGEMSDIGEDAYMNLVFTRSTALPTPDENGEAGVHSLRVFVYNTAGELEFTQKYVSGTGHIENPIIKVKAGVKAVYAIVNEEASGVDATDLSGKLTAASTLGSSSSDALKTLLVKYASYPRALSTGLLMTGYVENVTVAEGRTRSNPQKVIIDVVRNCARLDLKIQKSENAALGTVVIQKIEFGNGCDLQTLFESGTASANPAGAAYGLSYTPYESSAGFTITHSQSAAGDDLQDIGTYYLPENLGNYTDSDHGNAEFIRLTYMVNGFSKTTKIDLNPAEVSAKHYNIVRNTRYELAVTIDAEKPEITLNILDWDEQEVVGDVLGTYISVPGKVVMDWWNLGESYSTKVSFKADGDVTFLGYYVNGVRVNTLPSWISITAPQFPVTSGTFELTYTPTGGSNALENNGVHDDVVIRLKRGNITRYVTVVYDHGYIPNEFLQGRGWKTNLPAKGIHLAKKGNKLPNMEAGTDVVSKWWSSLIREDGLIEPALMQFRVYEDGGNTVHSLSVDFSELLGANNPSPQFGNGLKNTLLIRSHDSSLVTELAELNMDWYIPSVGEMVVIGQYYNYLGVSYKYKETEYYCTSSLCHLYSNKKDFYVTYVTIPGARIYDAGAVESPIRAVVNVN